MKSTSLAALSILTVVSVSAYPQQLVPSADVNIYSDWQKPTPSDSRSPCPALNSLANHGILPRNGRGITLPILIKALSDGVNVAADFSLAIGNFGLSTSPIPASDSFDLNNLNKHGAIEHDNSLSRQDYFFGNDSIFHQSIFNQVLNQQVGDNFNVKNAEKGRQVRIQDSFARNPNFTLTPKELILSAGETSLYLSILSSPILLNPSIAFVKSLFEDEKLPYDQGWRKSPIPITLQTLALNIGQLQQSSGTAVVGQNFLLTAETLGAIFSGREVQGLTPCYLNGTTTTTPCQ